MTWCFTQAFRRSQHSYSLPWRNCVRKRDPMKIGYTAWRPLLGLLSWYPIVLVKSLQIISLRWRHNGRHGVSNRLPHDCLPNRLFMRRSKKTSKFRVTGLYAGNSPVTGQFFAQMASNAENASIWWRHHGKSRWRTWNIGILDLQMICNYLTMNEKYLLPKLYREQTFNHTSTWHSINDNSGKNGVITTLAKGAEVKTYMCRDLKREHQDRGPSNDHEYELQYCVTLQYIITDLHVHFCFFSCAHVCDMISSPQCSLPYDEVCWAQVVVHQDIQYWA